MSNNNEQTLSPEQAAAHLQAAYLADDNHMRDLAKQALRSSSTTEESSIADAKAVLDEHFAVGR